MLQLEGVFDGVDAVLKDNLLRSMLELLAGRPGRKPPL